MKNKKIAILLAKGFEEVEAIGIIDVLRRGGVEVVMTSITKEREVLGAHQVKVFTDASLESIDSHAFCGVVLPGGLEGSYNMKKSQAVIDFVRNIHDAGGLVASICAAAIVFDAAGILDGKNFTCYPGIEAQIKTGHYENNRVVQDGQLITAYGPGATLHFAIALVRHLVDDVTADALVDGMLI